MNNFKTYFFCLCCCLLGSSFSTDLFANINDCIEDDVACEEALMVSNRMNDSLALVALYNATNGANWTNTWDLNQPMDTWYGVTLNGNGRVICLDLDGGYDCDSDGGASGNNLVGFVPIELGQLTNLVFLSLASNQLSGSIPTELGQLINLTYFRIDLNQLTGSIPNQLGQLSNLTWLTLANNQLTGSIPSQLGQLSNLNYLILSNNQLTGSIPSQLGQLSNLNYLDIFNNQLTGSIPSQLGQLSNLKDLNLSNNQLTGNIPNQLEQLTNLVSLNLGFNQLSGNIPSELGQLVNLSFFYLRDNQLTGSIPSQLGQLSNLNYLDISDNQLSGNIPAELGQLINITNIHLGNNQLSSSIPLELGQLSNLMELYIYNNQLSGSIPSTLGQLSNLKILSLYNNQLDGNIPTELSQLSKLTRLFLRGNQLSGSIPNQLGQLTNLTYLHLYNNQLSGNIPAELGNISSLTRLLLHGNQLSGNIPNQLGQLTNLEVLNLGNNQLNGSIPPELGNLSSLRYLLLYENNLSGNIPSELGNLNFTNTSQLYLSNNNLSGCFPPELSQFCNISEVSFHNNPNLPNNGDFSAFCSNEVGMCDGTCAQRDSLALIALYNATDGANWTNTWDLNQPMETWHGVTLNEDRCVQSLTLSNNQLVGNIPPELGNLYSLLSLDLQSNQLNGNIPSELGNANSLKSLILDTNQLTGTIPTSLSNLTSLFTLAIQRNQLTGNIPSELGNLPLLQILALANNQLTGNIPPQLGNLNNLDWLFLNANQLEGTIPVELTQLTGLSQLVLSENLLSGNIPLELGNLTNLTWLSLSSNQLTGTIPAELGQLTNLTDLSLHSNQLSGCFPPELLSLCDVPNRLFFNNPDLPGEGDFNAFCDSGIGICEEGCAYRDSLALVALYNATDGVNWTNTWDLNQPMDTWYGVTLDENRCVTCLTLNGNQCTFGVAPGNNLVGIIPNELGNLLNLELLSLSSNQLSGTIPSELGNLTKLNILELHDNQISGSIPVELGDLINLSDLSLYNNNLTGNIPLEVGNLVSLINLVLYNNNLTGAIPAELGSIPNLFLLALSNNQLTGNIPPELGNLSNLSTFNIRSNQINGSIPLELGNLNNLFSLNLKNNQLSGTIPTTLGNLNNLHFLDFNNNMLQGDLPSELGLLNNLEWLYLNNNQLTGNIPKELGQLSNLTRLYINDNQLSGCFFPELSALCGISDRDFTNNPDLPGGGDFDAFCNDGTGSCSISDVWPGDTNTDCFVDYNDVFTLGRKHGKTGTMRPNATTDWIGQPATDWGDTAPDDIDAKHADCNGDGLVDNSDDAAVIQLNYGESCDNGQATILENFSGDAIIQSYWRNPSAAPNTIEVDLHLQSLSNTDIELYGIGFTVDFSTVGVNPIWSAANSNFGQVGQNLYAFAQDLGNGTIDIALTRTDGNTAILTPTNNYLGTLTFQVNNANSNNHLAKANNGELYLRFHNAKMVDGTGQELSAMLGGTATASFGEGDAFASPVSFFTHATYTQDCHAGGTATVVPGSGAAPFTYLWDTGSTSPQADNLEVGQHQVTVTDASNVSLVGTIMILGDCATIALPVEWLNFTATAQTSRITLDWATANEIGIEQFEIQRSTNGIDFNTIATQVATGQSNAYQFIDKQVYPKQTYYYRIKTNEANKSHFSLVRTARLVTTFKEITALPNPVKEELTLYLDETNEEDVQVIIYNQMGQPIEQLAYTSNALQATLSIDFSTYPQGLYLVTIVQGEQQQALKIIKE